LIILAQGKFELIARVAIAYPGETRYALSDQVQAVPLGALVKPGQLFAAH